METPLHSSAAQLQTTNTPTKNDIRGLVQAKSSCPICLPSNGMQHTSPSRNHRLSHTKHTARHRRYRRIRTSHRRVGNEIRNPPPQQLTPKAYNARTTPEEVIKSEFHAVEKIDVKARPANSRLPFE